MARRTSSEQRTATTAGDASDPTSAGSATVQRLEEQLRAVRAIGAALGDSIGLDALFAIIVPEISKLMRAQRTTLFLYDDESKEIWSKLAQGESSREIRLPLGKGIAGWVAEHREAALIPDAYRDERFNSDVDLRTGFRTESVAAAPLVDRRGKLIGVLQVLNHADGPFTADDLGLLEAIGAQTAYAVENAHLSQAVIDQNRELEAARLRAERRRAELDLLYDLEQQTSASSDLDTLLDSVVVRTCERLRSEAGSVLLLDHDTGRLFFRGVMGPKKDELKKLTLDAAVGIVGWVAKNKEPVIVNRPSDDPRHGKDVADKLDYPAQAILAVPLVWDDKVIGAMEVLNPMSRATGAVGYDVEDMKLLTVIAGQVARAVNLTIERQQRLDTERLVVIGRMLAGVAHDLRNPMTVMSGYAQLMVGDPDEASRRESCDRVLHQVDEMTGMIADLLAFARGDTRLRPNEVDIDALGREIGDTLAPACKSRGISIAVKATPGSVLVDAGRCKRIVYNLAKNAIEALGRGGQLSVELGVEADALLLRVADNGPGLPSEVASRMFEPFVTAGKQNGTGLGLSIVKRFVEDHKGEVKVQSTPGKGTTFDVRLPSVSTGASLT